MGFKENLLKKIEIDRLARHVLVSMGTPENPRRMDLESVRQLLEMSSYQHQRERDLDLYLKEEASDRPLILVLDNELKLYRTTIADVVLRKSPIIKEMVSIRNAIKILSDKDVVVSRKADTLLQLQQELIAGLDLSWTPADIEALVQDGRDALTNSYTEGLSEVLILLAELLGYQQAPKAFQVPHHKIWGAIRKPAATEIVFGPLAILSLVHSTLKLIRTPLHSLNKENIKHFQQVIKGERDADGQGPDVLETLKLWVLESKASP